jgi:DNA-binding NarL/FixJ family response regulator
MGKIKILIADDHPMVLEGIKKLLEEKDGEVMGTVEDGRALVEAAKQLRPDVILVDISMPVLNGLEATRQIKKNAPGCKVIFLTMHADLAYAREAFDAGGSGYLLKRSAATELQEAIRTVLGGRTYLTPLIDHEDLAFSRNGGAKGLHQLGNLTPRQREVLQLLAEGHSTKEIATILIISMKTVEFHKTKIREALGIHTTAELTQYASNHGLVVKT